MLITIITEDEFGRSIPPLLEGFETEVLTLRQGEERDWKYHGQQLVAFCTDRPYHAVFEELSGRLVKAELSVTFACIAESILTVGPLIVPGKSPCYGCYRRRLLSHTGPPWSIAHERVVQSAFDRDWSLKSPGLLPTTPILAAARLRRHARLAESDCGLVTQVSLTEPRWVDFKIRRVHGCGCLPSPGGSGCADMVSVVEKLLA
jgi:hypothetical protein